ncbi:hypothetical protein COL84_13605 [Bacillus pseudomycoides]|nr:hypothetical protein COO06_08005 [Bacillus pseudomycoides]PGA62204.1 hypothetical protein COL84_13605 [Bacillus pseudomycoides]
MMNFPFQNYNFETLFLLFEKGWAKTSKYEIGMTVFDIEFNCKTQIIDIDNDHIITEYDMIRFSLVNKYLTVIK